MSSYFGRRPINVSRFKNIKRNVINVCVGRPWNSGVGNPWYYMKGPAWV